MELLRDARLGRVLIVGLTAILSMAVLRTAVVASSAGPPVRVGDAVVVDDVNRSDKIDHGGSATTFSLRLPEGATCPGDSAHDQWRVQGFVTPATDDPGSLHYGVIGPDGHDQYALYDTDGNPFAHVLTQQNMAAGQPGVISGIPPLSFGVFVSGTLPAGRYRIGISCTLFRVTAKYWDTEVIVEDWPSDKPAGLRWRLATAPPNVNAARDGAASWLPPTITGFAVLGLGVGAFIWYRNRHRSHVLAKDGR